MRFARSGRFVFLAQWVAAALLPVVFFFGRAWLEAESGPSFRSSYAVLTIPLLLVPPLLTLFDTLGRRERSTRFGYDVASVVLWLAIVLGGLALPESDAAGPRDSAIMNTFGISYGIVSPIFTFAVAVIALAYLAQVVLAVIGIVRGRRKA